MATLQAEGVTIESAFLDQGPDGDFLIYYMRAHDMKKAMEAGRALTVDIQNYHRQFKKETWESVSQLECLIDFENLE